MLREDEQSQIQRKLRLVFQMEEMESELAAIKKFK